MNPIGAPFFHLAGGGDNAIVGVIPEIDIAIDGISGTFDVPVDVQLHVPPSKEKGLAVDLQLSRAGTNLPEAPIAFERDDVGDVDVVLAWVVEGPYTRQENAAEQFVDTGIIRDEAE